MRETSAPAWRIPTSWGGRGGRCYPTSRKYGQGRDDRNRDVSTVGRAEALSGRGWSTFIHDESPSFDSCCPHTGQDPCDSAKSRTHIRADIHPAFGSFTNTLSNCCWQIFERNKIGAKPDITITRNCDHQRVLAISPLISTGLDTFARSTVTTLGRSGPNLAGRTNLATSGNMTLVKAVTSILQMSPAAHAEWRRFNANTQTFRANRYCRSSSDWCHR